MTSAARSRWVAHRRYIIEHTRALEVKCKPMVAHRVEPEHGTRARYVHRAFHCRCLACCAENTHYQRDYRHKQRIARATHQWQQPTLPGVGDR